jgi:cytochrome c oxidase subunit 4
MAQLEHEHSHDHPGPAQYVEIAVILAVFTAIEVVLYEGLKRGLAEAVAVPGLIVVTLLKFALVVLWFMHLRFDHKLFRRVFAVGVLLALGVFGVVAATFYLGQPGNVSL